jgi:hypothetical protein
LSDAALAAVINSQSKTVLAVDVSIDAITDFI